MNKQVLKHLELVGQAGIEIGPEEGHQRAEDQNGKDHVGKDGPRKSDIKS